MSAWAASDKHTNETIGLSNLLIIHLCISPIKFISHMVYQELFNILIQ